VTTNSRADVEAAFDKLAGEAGEAPPEVELPPEPVTDAEAAPVAVDDAPPVETKAERAERLRTPDGRYAETPKEKADAAAAAAKAQSRAPVKPAPVAQAQQELKPPQSLKPLEREAFKTWPKEAQEAFRRREVEIARGLQEKAEPARFGQQAMQTLQPFAATIQAMGGNPIQAMETVFRSAHVLQVGTPAQRAEVIASLLSQYGVDVDLVNARLEGRQAPQSAQQPFDINAITQQVRQSVFGELQQQRQAQAARQADAEVAKFAEAHPYFEDVRPKMALLMKAAADEAPLSRGVAKGTAFHARNGSETSIPLRGPNGLPQHHDLTTTTIENRSKKIADNVTKNNALLYTLERRARSAPSTVATYILEELSFAENSNAMFYSGYDVISTAAQDVLSAAQFSLKQAACAVTYSGLEILQNSGREKMIDLVEKRAWTLRKPP
jgi:hypothetical protein